MTGTSSIPGGATANTSPGCSSASASTSTSRCSGCIYWLRQPQVGEDIDPARLAEQLVNALPFVDPDTVSAAGATFDELEAYGEEIERRARSAESLTAFAETYAGYARSVVAVRGRTALAATKEVRDARRALTRAGDELGQAQAELAVARADHEDAQEARAGALARIAALETSPEARSRQHLLEVAKRVETLHRLERDSAGEAGRAHARGAASASQAADAGTRLGRATHELRDSCDTAATALTSAEASALPPPAAAAFASVPSWELATDIDSAADALRSTGAAHATWVETARTAVGQVLAAVRVVDEARLAAASAEQAAASAQETADDSEARAESVRTRLAEAARTSSDIEEHLLAALAAWRGADVAVELVLPELTAEALAGLEGTVSTAVAPRLRDLADERAAALSRRDAARRSIGSLRSERSEIESRVDPTPPVPGWVRHSREGEPGAPLWRLVDVVDGVGDAERAGLEAALEGAGLLDAWVRPDGGVLDADRHDVTLIPLAAASGDGDTLARWLGPSIPDDADVSADVVAVVLASVGALVPSSPPPNGLAPDHTTAAARAVEVDPDMTGAGAPEPSSQRAVAVGPDGSWVAGPARGRTSKPVAQYLGASARAAERARRLAELDARIAEEERAQAQAEQAAAAAERARSELEAWVVARPAHDALLRSWSREETLGEERSRAEAELGVALTAARAARERASGLHAELVALGERHGLPVTASGLDLRRERLRSAGEALDKVLDARSRLDATADTWADLATRARADAAEVARLGQRHADAETHWTAERDTLEELRQMAGAGISELEARLAEQQAARDEADLAMRRHADRRDGLLGTVGALAQAERTARDVLAETEPRRTAAYDAFTALHAVPGLVGAARIGADAERPPTEAADVRRLTEAAEAAPRATLNDVLQAMTVVQSGPASVVEPRLVDVDGVHAAVGRADGIGDLPLNDLAARLAASVATDRELLTDRERGLFEKHILGQLGDALRAVRRQADELVEAMNSQLRTVSTSQGIRVRLRWRLREDIPADARGAVELLGQPVGALLPDERSELRESLHRLIDHSRAEVPEDSYTEHLARALDYRQWFAFTVQYHRPESGQWRDLQRRSALSQGEQKVLCYLPLFAAAAAHFTSLAGAAPHAPRFVLLDDAFPKIDARTHPLLFGLLVDLDLDFVVTSERLWGTHATVPSLAIYEALRSPNERGIAQYEHRWDGHQLLSVGAGG